MPDIATMTPVCRRCGAIASRENGDKLCAACLLEAALINDDGDFAPTTVLMDFGDYELIEELGRGGQGVVYRARQKGLNRIVALKIIGLGHWATEAHLKRFRTEAEAAAQLDHPAIVPIYEIGERDGACFFSMKFIEGGQLDELVRRTPLSIREAAALLAKVARTVHYAHENGVLHRDIKPGNILLDRKGDPHLTDFGLARLVEKESNVTRTMDVLGTPSYMAPEQAAGKNESLTPATDVYGLGAVLYHLLTRQPPFAGGTTYETIRMVLETEPRKPRAWNSKVDRDLETICLKCLEKEPRKRYASALELAEDLEHWSRHEPIRARPAGVITRTLKWVRRNPALAVLFPAAAVILASFVSLLWQSLRHSITSANDNSIAVVVRSVNAESSSLAHEYARQLTEFFSHVSAFKVAPRSQVLKWENSTEPSNEIVHAVGTRFLLLGSVRRIEDASETSLELIDTRDNSVKWTRKWSGREQDAPAMETQVVREVASIRSITLNDTERSLLRRPLSTNQSALREYFAGRRAGDTITAESLREAIRHFEEATRIDPKFAQAHAALASTYVSLGYNFDEPAKDFRAARHSNEVASQLDSTLVEARVTEGVLKYFYDWDWSGATAALDDALRLDPSFVEADACYLHSVELLQQPGDPLRKVRQAVALHPSSVAIRSELGCAAYYAGQVDQSADFYSEMLKIDPDNPMLYWGLARAQAQQEHCDDAFVALAKAETKPGGDWPGIAAERGYVLARIGKADEARAVLRQLHAREVSEFVDPYFYAIIHAGLNEPEEMLRELNSACEKKSSFIPTLPLDPKLARMHGNPGFQQLLERLKFPRRVASPIAP
jgi:serine/threonine protein kinase